MATAAVRLSADGVGLFVVPPSFFFSPRSVLHHFANLGLSVEAALALPSGSFAPYTNIPTYLVVVRKRSTERMFVAQLSSDVNTNRQIVSNFTEGRDTCTVEFGRFVEPLSFKGLDFIRLADRLEIAECNFGHPAIRLDELATSITLGRAGGDFVFRNRSRAKNRCPVYKIRRQIRI